MLLMTMLPPNHPVMKAYDEYQSTDDFKTALIWATATDYRQAGRERHDGNNAISNIQREQHAKGSLWSAFMAGFKAATDRAAALHESVDPASDEERIKHIPGAGGMGAVIQYRDMIRTF